MSFYNPCNQYTLIGTVGSNISLKSSSRGKSYTHFVVSVYKAGSNGNKGTYMYIPVVAFGQTAEMLAKYFPKGKPIVVGGSIECNKDQNDQYEVSIVASAVGFVPKEYASKEQGFGGGDASAGSEFGTSMPDDGKVQF